MQGGVQTMAGFCTDIKNSRRVHVDLEEKGQRCLSGPNHPASPLSMRVSSLYTALTREREREDEYISMRVTSKKNHLPHWVNIVAIQQCFCLPH